MPLVLPPRLCLKTMVAVSHSASAVSMPTAAAAFLEGQIHWVTPDECIHIRTVYIFLHASRGTIKGRRQEKQAGEIYTGGKNTFRQKQLNFAIHKDT